MSSGIQKKSIAFSISRYFLSHMHFQGLTKWHEVRLIYYLRPLLFSPTTWMHVWCNLENQEFQLSELHVILLDLENAYGSVRHPLIEKAMDFFWIPEDIRKLISGYYKFTYMRFSNAKYSTNWQKLNIVIMMGCVISPLIFVLVIEMLLRSTKDTTSKKTVPSIKM